MSLSHFHDTVAAISTPEGTSALAIVRVTGSDALTVVSKIIDEPEKLWVARGSSSVYADVLATASVKIDDVLIHIYRAPHSFSGEDTCEITSHGSPVIARQILSRLIESGARQAEPGEFSRRAFLNGKIGIEDAELISLKAEAGSEHELRGAERAIHEKFRRLRTAYDSLISIIALVDAEIDFGESDQVLITDFDERLRIVAEGLDGLIRDSTNRRANAGVFTLALTGPPNVGKSSVFNALLNFERSIVSPVPGTTRDYVESFIDVGGFRVKLVDTAGIREAAESIEERGIHLGRDAASYADIVLRLTDDSDRTPEVTSDVVLLHNKIDIDRWKKGLRVSAATGEGIQALHSWLAGELRHRSSDFSQIRLSDSERSLLQLAVERLSVVSLDTEPAILSEELRLSAKELSSILGLDLGSASLDYIFAKMCIGK